MILFLWADTVMLKDLLIKEHYLLAELTEKGRAGPLDGKFEYKQPTTAKPTAVESFEYFQEGTFCSTQAF